MSPTVGTYVAYLGMSVIVTIWVARTLHKNGRIFLVDSYHGHETLADSVNHLFVVGFYLMNLGWASLALRVGPRPASAGESIEIFSTKIGLVLVVLGIMNFFNLYVYTRMRRRALLRQEPPPVRPQECLT